MKTSINQSHSSFRHVLFPEDLKSRLVKLFSEHKSKSVSDTVRSIFKSADDEEPTGRLLKREFRYALRSIYQSVHNSSRSVEFNSWISDDELGIIIDCFPSKDPKHKGSIIYDDLLLCIDDDGVESRDLVLLHDILQNEVFTKSKMKVKDIEKMFSSFRTALHGFCRTSEFEKTVTKMFAKISSNDLELVSDRFDRQKDGIVDFSLFSLWLSIGVEPKQVCKE
jgi:Ca2+-binding EF-hand superfamily protein